MMTVIETMIELLGVCMLFACGPKPILCWQAGDNSPRVPKLGSGLKLAPDDEDVCPTCLEPYLEGALLLQSLSHRHISAMQHVLGRRHCLSGFVTHSCVTSDIWALQENVINRKITACQCISGQLLSFCFVYKPSDHSSYRCQHVGQHVLHDAVTDNPQLAV